MESIYVDYKRDDGTTIKVQKEGFCFCEIGAGGKPCLDRPHCDEQGDSYFAAANKA